MMQHDTQSHQESEGFLLGFWSFFLYNRAFTYFLVIIALVAGAWSLVSIPKESTPEITLPIAIVQTSFFGASAGDVETLITKKIEQQVGNLSEVDTYESTSAAGFSTVVVTFEQGADIDERVTRLKESVDQIKRQLPQDGNDPVVSKVEFSSQPVFTVSLISEMPLYSFKQVVDDFVDELLEIDEVAQVTYSGVPEREVVVMLDNRVLTGYNLDFNTVLRITQSGNVTLPGGTLEINGVDYAVDIQSSIDEVDSLGAIPLVYNNGGMVRLDDVALIKNGFAPQETITQVGFPGGETLNAITVNVSKKNGGDITRLTQDIQETIMRLEESVLVGVDTVVTYDAGNDIKQDLGDLTQSGLQTVALVFLILLIFVGFRESVIAALSIPFSFLIAFVAFMVVGNTINFISLFSLILSIGILVDSAIVIVEGINSKITQGMRRQDAAIATVREFGLPLFAGTMTTIAVFFPLLFLSGIIGQFIRGIPFTVILVLLASMFVSLGFVTVFCASLLHNRDHAGEQQGSWANRQFNKIETRYRAVLTHMVHHSLPRRLFQSAITLLAVLSLSLIPLGLVKVVFFPGGDLELAYIRIEMDNGTMLEETEQFTKEVEALLQDEAYIDSYVTTVGATSQFEEEALQGDRYAHIIINVDREYAKEGVSLVRPLREQLEQTQFQYAELVAEGGGPPTGSAIDVSFTSDSDQSLRQAVLVALNLLRETEGVENIDSTLAGNTSGFEVVVDRNAANRFGVSMNDIATVIRGATDGIELFDITENDDDVPVILRNNLSVETPVDGQTNRITPDMLSALTVINNQGQEIVLGVLIDVRLSETDVEINHTDGERVINITADVAESYNANDIRMAFKNQLEETVGSDISFSFGGEQNEQDESFAEVGVAFMAGIFLMFAVLILQFGRWRQVLIIMSVLLYALSGVLVGLFISANALSFPAILGTIALFGIVVNNSIILVSVFNAMRREHPEWNMNQVVVEGSVSRLRPILLTTITTIIGVSPLLTASAIWAPIAYAIIFGLLFCVVVTLFIVPILYRRFEGFSTGSWSTVGSWYINFALLVVAPVLVLLGIVFLGTKIDLTTAAAMYAGVVLALLLAYVLTHWRESHQ